MMIDRIRHLYNREGMSRAEFCEKAGISYSTVQMAENRYDENKDQSISYSKQTIYKILKAFPGWDVKFVLFGKPESKIFDSDYNLAPLTADQIKDIPFFKDIDSVFVMRGNSMDPLIKAGNLLLCQKIISKEFILSGEMYLFITKIDQIEGVRYFYKSNKPDHYLIKPLNTTEFESQEIDMNSLIELFMVKSVVFKL